MKPNLRLLSKPENTIAGVLSYNKVQAVLENARSSVWVAKSESWSGAALRDAVPVEPLRRKVIISNPNASISAKDVEIAIFSYNRGPFLQNLLTSIRENFPKHSKIRIFDDNSDDTPTLEVLDLARAQGVGIELTDNREGLRARGGFYSNMQAAFASSESKLLFFMEDDTQVVRRVNLAELDRLHRILDCAPTGSPFLSVNFLKHSIRSPGKYGGYTSASLADESTEPLYLLSGSGGKPLFFTTMLATKPEALRNVGWHFQATSGLNRESAIEKFGPMPMWAYPFTSYLPWPVSHRFQRMTVAQRIWEQRVCGFHPYLKMPNSVESKFLGRNLEISLPYAEDWLSIADDSAPRPWRFSGFTEAPKIVRGLAGVETWIRLRGKGFRLADY